MNQIPVKKNEKYIVDIIDMALEEKELLKLMVSQFLFQML